MLGSIFVHVQQPKPPVQVVQSYAGGLTVRAPVNSINVADQTVEWSGGVEATYGPTTVTADRFVVHDDPENPYGEATGSVKLVDPEGTITASHLKFFWKSRTGSAENVAVRVSMLSLTARSADIAPDLWTLHDVGGTGCQMKTPLYYVHVRELLIRPSQGVRAVRPAISILGFKLMSLPSYTYRFHAGGNSLNIPYPGLRSGNVGLTWTNQFNFGSPTQLFTRYATFEHSLPYYNATFMRSFLPGHEPEPLRTELGDRFSFGYFDSVQVRDPKAEQLYFGTPRFDLGVSSTFGEDARDTTTTINKINKPLEALGQVSGKVLGFGVLGLFRAQQLRVGNSPSLNRLILEENVLTPSLAIGRNLSVFGRTDIAEFSGGNHYWWVRGQAGLVYQPDPHIRLGASYTAVRAHGMPDFAYDAPLRFREVNLRGDFDFDTTQLRILFKYDPILRKVYDHEVYVSRVIGCIEPYVVYRERPHKLFIGLMLPLTRVFERLSKDELDRRAAIRNTLSGTP